MTARTPRYLREARYWPEAQQLRAIQENVAPRRRGNYGAALISGIALIPVAILLAGAWLFSVACADQVVRWFR